MEIISLEFHETLMAPSGHQALKQLEDAIETFKGNYLLFVAGFNSNGYRMGSMELLGLLERHSMNI